MLEILDISVVDQDRAAIHNVTCKVARGEIVGIVGPNGSGKATLLEVVAGVVRVARGRVRLDTADITDWSAPRRFWNGIIFVPKAGVSLFGDLTVEDHFTLVSRRIPGVNRQLAINAATESFPLIKDRRRALARSLSGGERQALALAMAVACDPTIMLLDEPSHGLSPSMRDSTATLLSSLKTEARMILVAEQFPRLVRDVSDRLLVMKDGCLSSI
jgi:ABC-type branched-subunit amino acid transport system ATPase component